MTEPKRIAVVGGGIAGIAAALRLAQRADCRVTLLEAGPRLGGVLDTFQRDGCLVERSADMFTTKAPWALELCRETGYDAQLIQVNTEHRRAFLVSGGKLAPVPPGLALLKPVNLGALLRSPLLSPLGKLRLLAERSVVARRDQGDESLASFARRRYGREMYERIVQPLIGGIYTADPELLSMQATLPQFVEMERKHGSLIRAARRDSDASDRAASGARYDRFVTPREGFRHLIDHLAARLPAECVRTNAAVRSATRSDEPDGRGWKLAMDRGETLECDAVLVAAPAPAAAEILRRQDADLADELGAIPYAGSSVVVAAFQASDFGRPLNGFGLVAPLAEGRKVLAISFSSVKFAGRAPSGQVLLRAFVGGAVQPELNRLDDAALCELVREELRQLVKLQGEPLWMDVVRWPAAMPQYHVGHVERVARIKRHADRHAGLSLAGAAYRGVGIPFCVRSGRAAADRILQQLDR